MAIIQTRNNGRLNSYAIRHLQNLAVERESLIVVDIVVAIAGQIVPLGSWPELKQYITECILSWCLDSILLDLFALLLNRLPKSYISTIPKHVQDALVDKLIDLVFVNPFDSDCVTYNTAKASFSVIVYFPSDNKLVRLFQVVADNVLDFIISEQVE